MTEKDKLAELNDFLKHDVEVSFLDGDVIDVAMDVITKLIEKIKDLENIIYQDARQGVLESLYEENKRQREALEFYADEDNYEHETIVSDCDIEVESKILEDGGQKARKVLWCIHCNGKGFNGLDYCPHCNYTEKSD